MTTQQKTFAINSKDKAPVVTFIGGGSYTWGWILLRDLFSSPELIGTEVRLHDIDAKAARNVLAASHTLQKRARSKLIVKVMPDLNRALDGADYVVIAIQQGGLFQFQHEVDIPAKYGCFQPVSGTTGPGMVARTMANAPVFLDVARRMERLCPRAWMLNFTNPLTTLGRMVTKHTRIQTVGICHGVLSARDLIANTMGVPRNEVKINFGGVNHGSYVLDAFIKGVSVYDEFRRRLRERIARRNGADDLEIDPLGHISGQVVRHKVLERLYYLSSNNDRHHSEFYPYFLKDGGRRYRVRPTRVERRIAGMDYAEYHTRMIAKGKIKIPVEAGGEPANDIILARHFGKPYYGPMNLPNIGQISNLPLGAIVETPGVADAGGMRPIIAGPMPMEVLPYTLTQVAIHELAVEAAETGDARKALAAVLADPLTRDWDTAPAMVAEMIHASRKNIPHPVKILKRPGQPYRRAKNKHLAMMAELNDRCLVDYTAAFFKEAAKGRRWDNPSMLTPERIKLAREEKARIGRYLDVNGKDCLATAVAESAKYPLGDDDLRWFLHGTRRTGQETEFIIAADQEEVTLDEHGKQKGPGPFVNMYYLPAFCITVKAGRTGGIFRRGVYMRRCAAFLPMDTMRFTSRAELRGRLTAGLPEAVLQAGQKAMRSMDARTYPFAGWRQRLPEKFKSQKLLRELRDAGTDLELCHAIALHAETLPVPARHFLEELAGKVYFSLATDHDPAVTTGRSIGGGHK